MTHHIPVSVLELAIIRAGDSAADAIQDTIKIAQHAEQEGFRRVWLAEHHNMPSIASTATSLLIDQVAGKTERIRVGSGGIMLPNHSNLSVAETFGTLNTLYPGRIDLGLGRAPGTDPATAAALRRNFPPAHYDFKANIEEVRSYFDNTDPTAPVRAFIAEGADVPVWILGSSPDSAYLAAEMGLPYAFAAHFAPAQLLNAASIYKGHFKPSAHLSAPYFMACINIIAADTNEEAQLYATSLYQMFAGIITNQRRPMPPPVRNFDKTMDPQLFLALQQMLYYTFVGDKAILKQELGHFIRESGVNELMTTSYIFDIEQRKKSLSIISDLMQEL